jgi:hypothetical protein
VKPKRWLASFGLLVLSALISLCLVELFFRIVHDPRSELSAAAVWESQRLDPDVAQHQSRTEIGGTSFLEDPLDPEIFGEDFVRILFLGDSFTEGGGIPNSEDRFSDLIESRLNRDAARDQGPYRFHIFNAGKQGTEPERWFGYARVLLPVYRPHAVFAVFFLRDGTDLGTSLKFNKALVRGIKKRYDDMYLYDHSYAMRFIVNRLVWRDFTAEYKRILTLSYLGPEAERKTWEIQKDFLLEISAICEAEAISFHLVIFPLLFDLKHYAFHEVEDEIAGFARGHGISVFSLTPGFLGHDDHTLWLSNNNQHPNQKGHRIAAETLLPFLEAAIAEKIGKGTLGSDAVDR